MINDTNTKVPAFSSHAERLAFFSQANLNTPPIMPAVIRRDPPRARRHSVRHRAIR